MATIDHYPPEANYGGEYYSSGDENEYDEEEEEEEELVEEIFEEEEIIEEEYVHDEEYIDHEEEGRVEYDDDDDGELLDKEVHEVDLPVGGGGMAAMIAAHAQKRTMRIDGGGRRENITSSATSATSSASDDEYDLEDSHYNEEQVLVEGTGMAAMIAAAASKRNRRIDLGGDVKIREVAPAPESTPDAQGFAAMAAAAASKRHDRIEAGGELQVREVQEVPEEHRNVFVTIAEEAANMGRLVRLNEVVVEAESGKSSEEVDTWSGPGGLLADYQRSQFIRAVNEAAAMGRMRRSKPTEVTNYDTTLSYEEEQRVDIDKLVDEHGRKALRTKFLLDEHVKEELREKRDQWAPENLDAPVYRSIDDVELPTERLPSFKPKKINFTSQRDALEEISRAVAASAWERNYRLQRPKAELRVTRGCACPYCKNPNPYQTHKYKKMFSNEMPDAANSDRPKDDKLEETTPEEETTEVPFYLKPPEGKIYEPSKPEDEKKRGGDQEYSMRKVGDAPKTVRNWQPPKKTSVPAAFQGANTPTPKPYQPWLSADNNRVVVPSPLPTQIADEDTCEPVPLSANSQTYTSTTPTPSGGYYSSSNTGTKVLLDETIHFGTTHKKVHIKKEKVKKTKTKGKPKSSKNSAKEGGCAIM